MTIEYSRRSFLLGTASILTINDQYSAIKARQQLELNYQYDLLPNAPGRIGVQIQFDIPSSVTRFGITFNSGISIQETDGFAIRDERSLRWEGENNSPSVTYSVDVNKKSRGTFSSYASRSWALFNKYTPGLADNELRCRCNDLEYRFNHDFSTQGFVGDALIWLGSSSEVTQHSIGEKTLKIIIPDVSNSKHSRERIATTLSAAATELDVGNQNHVNLFTVPDPFEGGAAFPDSGDDGDVVDMFVYEAEAIDWPGNAWIHEYIHTRQKFELAEDSKWLEEAIAEFYTAYLTWNQDRISYSSFANHLRRQEGADVRLTQPSMWRGSDADYTKGGRVIAALDVKIRSQTNGEASFEDVFRQLNAKDNRITYTEFKQTVDDVVGRRLDEWLDRYIPQPGVPEIPENASEFWGGDSESERNRDDNSDRSSTTEREEPNSEEDDTDRTTTEDNTDDFDESASGLKISNEGCGEIEVKNLTESWISFLFQGRHSDIFMESGERVPNIKPGETKTLQASDDLQYYSPVTLTVKALRGKPENMGDMVPVNGKHHAEVTIRACQQQTKSKQERNEETETTNIDVNSDSCETLILSNQGDRPVEIWIEGANTNEKEPFKIQPGESTGGGGMPTGTFILTPKTEGVTLNGKSKVTVTIEEC